MIDDNTLEEQIELVDKYISFYEQDFMGAESYLKNFWKKSDFIQLLLGPSMYKEYPNFIINANSASLDYNMTQLLDNNKFVSNYTAAVHYYISTANLDAATEEQIKGLLLDFMEVNNLIGNTSKVKDNICLNGVEIQIKEGMKIMRALRKVSEALGLDMEEFEEFRREHAKILSTKTLRGTLCLSALPMDYLTLSDNSSNWKSCYNWHDNGLYHASTLAYIGAPNTIVAYLKDDKKNYDWDGTGEWNSKMWRQLIYIDQDFIVPGRAYPYDSEQLTEKIVGYLRELLSNNNINIPYTKIEADIAKSHVDHSITKATDECPVSLIISNANGYNDFYGKLTYWINAQQQYSKYENILFDNEVHCLKCGDVIKPGEVGKNIDGVTLRVCTKCRAPKLCPYCGGVINPSEYTISDCDNNEYHIDCWQEKEVTEGWLELYDE